MHTNPEFRQKIGRIIRREMVVRGLPPKRVAYDIGMDTSTICGYARGKILPTLHVALRLMKYLDLDSEELMNCVATPAAGSKSLETR